MRNVEKIDSTNQEEHIVSAVIHARPDALEAILGEIDQHPNMECAAWDEKGKLVLLVTTTSQRSAAMYIEQMQLRPGVLSATMIAHHFEPTTELDQPAEAFEHQTIKQELTHSASRSDL